jgi:outer membrane protein TolC
MSTLRHLIAASVGFAMTLTPIKPGSAQTLGEASPPRTPQTGSVPVQQPLSDRAESQVSPSQTGAVSESSPLKLAQTPATGTVERPVPPYLNPDPNPLQFPTKPEEVEIEGTQPITLEQALVLARRNNRNLQVAYLQLERARHALREAVAAEYPSLDLAADVTTTDSASAQIQQRQQQEQLGQSEIDTTSASFNGQVELSYDVFTSGRRSATIRAARRQVGINELEVERIDSQLQLDVANGYYDMQEADEQVRISQQAVRSAQRSLQDAEALERAGVGTRFDVLRAQVQLSNEQQNLRQGLRDQQVARRQLAQLLSVSQVVDLSAADPVAVAGFWNLSLEESIVLAYRNRAELEQQLLQREIDEQQEQIALSANRPQVSVFANYNVLDVFEDEVSISDGYSLGARLRWNLYDGGAAKARARQENTDREIAETQFADQRNQVRLQVEQSYYDLRANFDNIQTASVEVERSREALRLARLRFQAGVGTQGDVIDAESELTRSESNRVRAILGYNRALATMERSVSNLPGTELTVSP